MHFATSIAVVLCSLSLLQPAYTASEKADRTKFGAQVEQQRLQPTHAVIGLQSALQPSPPNVVNGKPVIYEFGLQHGPDLSSYKPSKSIPIPWPKPSRKSFGQKEKARFQRLYNCYQDD